MKYISSKIGSDSKPCCCLWHRLIAKECSIKRPRVRREDDAYFYNVNDALDERFVKKDIKK